MKYIILCYACVSILSCKRGEILNHNDESYEELVFIDNSFKGIFEKSLADLQIDMEGANKNILLQLYIDSKENYDTIIAIRNCPPTTVRDLLLVKKYKGRNIYIYTNKNLIERFNKLVKLSDDSLTSVNLKPIRGEFECIYEKSFKLNNNKITPRE